MAPVILYFLQSSRAIRTAFLLEELGIDYEVKHFDREANGDTPAAYREAVTVGRSPAIKDGDLTIVESIAIAEYLCETYDTSHRLLPSSPAQRAKVRTWMAASEGTFLVHALAIAYGSGAAPEAALTLQEKLSRPVHRDFDWLEGELKAGGGRFLVGDHATAADTLMHLSIAFILKNGLGTKGKEWPAIESWLANVQGLESYQRAIEKTEYTY